MLKNKEALQSIIARHVDCKPEQVTNDPKLYVEDITMSDVVLMVQEIVYLVTNETIENAKAHSDTPSDTDWEGTQVNTIKQFGFYPQERPIVFK